MFLVTATGATINQNCTYLRNPSFPSVYSATSSLSYTVNKCSTGKNLFHDLAGQFKYEVTQVGEGGSPFCATMYEGLSKTGNLVNSATSSLSYTVNKYSNGKQP